MRKTTTLWAVLALLTTLTLAYAQPEGDRPRDGDRPPREGEGRPRGPREGDRPGDRDFRPPMPPLMIALDTDKDGEISAEEIKQAAESLKTLDKNDDGILDREELRPERGGPGRGPRDGEGRPPREGDRPRGDGDARPPREGDRPPGDRERGPDGRGRGADGPSSGGPEGFVDRMMEHDTDGDGKLSREELLKAAENFRRDRGRGGREGGEDRPQRPE